VISFPLRVRFRPAVKLDVRINDDVGAPSRLMHGVRAARPAASSALSETLPSNVASGTALRLMPDVDDCQHLWL